MTTDPFEDFEGEESALPTSDIPPADHATYTQRVFRYAHHTIPDPGVQLSIEDVRKALIPYFPDLVQATTATKVEGDTLIVTFAKQTTRKGAAENTPSPALLHVVARLLALAPHPDALDALTFPQPLTLAVIAHHRDAIYAALQSRQDTQYHCRKIFERCTHLPPTPLLRRLPLGF